MSIEKMNFFDDENKIKFDDLGGLQHLKPRINNYL